MIGFAVTPRAEAAIRSTCAERVLVPTVTWEQVSDDEGNWILAFHSVDRLSDQALACDIYHAAGLPFIIDGPATMRARLTSLVLDTDGRGFFFRRQPS